MRQKVKARIVWVPAAQGGRTKPPSGPQYSTVVRFEGDPDWPNEAWSIVAEWNPSTTSEEFVLAEVGFLVEEAPQHRLVPGAKFELYEGKRVVARGEVVKGMSEAPVRTAEGRFLRQQSSRGFVGRVTVSVSTSERPPVVSVDLEGEQWTPPPKEWKAAAEYGVSFALRVLRRNDCTVRILKILGTDADTNSTTIAAAAADAVWKALGEEPSPAIRSGIEKTVLGSSKADPDSLTEFKQA